jgi:hypothetical protein
LSHRVFLDVNIQQPQIRYGIKLHVIFKSLAKEEYFFSLAILFSFMCLLIAFYHFTAMEMSSQME